MSKTATQLALEYWRKPPIERVNNTVQDYVFDYQQSIIDELTAKINYALEFTENVHDENWQGVISDIVEALK